jgi:hypothetical protein
LNSLAALSECLSLIPTSGGHTHTHTHTHLCGGLLASQRKRAAFGGHCLAIAIDRRARGRRLVGAQCLEFLGAWRASERASSIIIIIESAECRNQNDT